MEITAREEDGILVLALAGRLDARWSEHVAASLEDALREGRHQLRLDLAGVEYISSAGIRILIRYAQQLQRIGGSFGIARPSHSVVEVLEMSGVLALLEVAAPAPGRSAGSVEREGGRFELHPLAPGARLRCQLFGDPDALERGYDASDCREVAYPDGSFGLGLGALGRDFADCRERFGEYLAVAGSASYLSGSDGQAPDFMLAEQALVPALQVLYGVRCQGEFETLARFEADPERGGSGLSPLVDAALELAGVELAGIAMVAESRGLLGAALRRAPLRDDPPDLGFPAIRRWLSFTGERTFPGSLALVAGIAARRAPGALAGLLRPLGGSGLLGHFHAAAFSYSPLPRGPIGLRETVRDLFEEHALLGLLHLLRDDREFAGAGESEFARGALWIGPLGELEVTSA